MNTQLDNKPALAENKAKISSMIIVSAGLVVSIAINVFQYASYSSVDKRLKLTEQSADFYRVKYQESYKLKADTLNDLLAAWQTAIKALNNSEMRGNRSESMDNVDNVNALAGSMRMFIDFDSFFSSRVMYDRFDGGLSERVLKSDLQQASELVEKGKGKAQRKITYYKKMSELKPGDAEPALPK